MLQPKKHWRLRQVPDDIVTELRQVLGVGPLFARLLALRGIADRDQAETFLGKRLQDLHRPEDLHDMDRAAGRLAQALEHGQRILIHGDFDVDGSTAATLMKLFCRCCSHDAAVWIPHRVDDGYGLSQASFEAVREHAAELLITVDCGITDHGWAARIEEELGCDVIITDHHLPGADLPQCTAVVNPNHPASRYPDRGLAGVGVAWKLCWATGCVLCASDRLTERLRQFLLEQLCLVAIGTVADCAPMDGENRILVHHGLQRLPQTANAGLRALLAHCRLEQVVSASDIGWRIGPLLNASGRLSSALRNVELLTNNDADACQQILQAVVEENNERRRLSQVLTEDLLHEVASCADYDNRNSLVFAGDDWHPGVVGIVASRLAERFGKPTCIIAIENGVGRGSLRTAEGIHLGEAIDACRAVLLKGGGHAAAAGISIAEEQVAAFSQAFEAFVRERQPGGPPLPAVEFDGAAGLAEFDGDFFDQLDQLAPFGINNPEPVLRVEAARFAARPELFGRRGEHLRGAITDSKGNLRPFYSWNGKEQFGQVAAPGQVFTALVRPEINRWRGNRHPRLVFVDGFTAA